MSKNTRGAEILVLGMGMLALSSLIRLIELLVFKESKTMFVLAIILFIIGCFLMIDEIIYSIKQVYK